MRLPSSRSGAGTPQCLVRRPPIVPIVHAIDHRGISSGNSRPEWWLHPAGGGSGWERAGARCTVAAAAAHSAPTAAEYEAKEQDQSLPAAEATLRMLEWSRLCSQVAAFASTTLGQQACAALRPPPGLAASQALRQETAAVDSLEAEYAADLDFGGVQTSQCAEALRRAGRGGMLTGALLRAIQSLLSGAAKLQRTIRAAAREADRTGYTGLQIVSAAFKTVATLPELVAEIGFSLDDAGGVRDSASEDVKRCRGRVRTVEGRLRSMLKSQAGEVSEHSGRICLAIPTTYADGPPKGILLGSGSGTWYVEPPAAVPLNNELAAARGEMYAAEEAVLWRLTGKVAEAELALQETLDKVVWLDAAAARARYGRWIGGTLAVFQPFPSTGRSRGGSKKREAAAAREGGTGDPVQEEAQASFVYLKRLRHPLLLGDYLLAAKQAEREARGAYSVGRGAGSSAGGGSGRRLQGRRPSNSADGPGSGSESESECEEGSRVPPLPTPIDVVVRPQTRVVVITGPNTGGKTAALKAFGLAAIAARCGLPIPAASPAHVPCFDAVLADIGDEQSLSASLSTFSGHLRRIEALRKESGSKSLVLLDELGTGTDPTEGSALGMALLQALARCGPGGAGLTLASTHHGALTSLKYEDERFENASVEFDEAKLAPTYRLLWGIPGRSNALNIAERLGLDSSLVGAARARLGRAAAEVNATISELEVLRQAAEADDAAAEEARKSAAAASGAARKLR